MENNYNVAIRVDANSTIGMGHLRRCLTLGQQLQKDGFTVRLLSRSPLNFKIDELQTFEIVQLREGDDAQATLSAIGRNPQEISWVIVDHYDLDATWEKIIHGAGHKVLAIDDFRHRTHHAHVLVSDNDLPFEPILSENEDFICELVGPNFALIDPRFAFSADNLPDEQEPKRVLISYGGSDATNETAKALAAIEGLTRKSNYNNLFGAVDIVIGPVNQNADQVTTLAKNIEHAHIHYAPSSLEPLLRKSHLFLTAGGNSMIEALTLRKPCLVTITADNQTSMVERISKISPLRVMGDHAEVSSASLERALIDAHENYRRIAEDFRSFTLFDHLGASRISRVMQSISAGLTNPSKMK